MWNLPGPGLEPVSPALAGGFLTTAPPGKPISPDLYLIFFPLHCVLATLNLLQFPQHNMLSLSTPPTVSPSHGQLLLALHDGLDITSSGKPDLPG